MNQTKAALMRLAERLALVLALGLLVPAAVSAKNCPADTSKLHRRIVSCRSESSLAECRKAVEAISCSVRRELPLINALVITIPDDERQTSDDKLMARPEVQNSEDDPYVKWIQSDGLMLPSFQFAAMPNMVANLKAAADSVPSVAAASQPVQPKSDGKLPWGIARVDAPAAWQKSMGEGVKVAIIDTGIDLKHESLKGNVKGGINVLDPKHPDNYMDDQGHGTHVAGIIAAIYGSGKGAGDSGVIGVAPKASLYAVKAVDIFGNSNYSSIIAGIEWSIKNKMQIINLSVAATKGNDALHQAVIAAQKAGIVVMAAAGNENGGPVDFPAAYPETICVSASDQNDQLTSLSNKGPEVNFIAPGQDIMSANLGGGYILHSGTSMATPHMTGLAALAIANGAQGFDAVKNALAAAAAPLANLPGEDQGSGMVDAAKLVR